MHGPELIAKSIDASRIVDKWGNKWQYLSRSDHHSKLACWVIAFDLLDRCDLLRAHVEDEKVVLAVNHSLKDFETGRAKKLDLVIARPASSKTKKTTGGSTKFSDLAKEWGIALSGEESAKLKDLPDPLIGDVGSVHVALEAKACMTEHGKARPRLHDELDSSHVTTHGNSKQALAAAFVMINASDEFLSADRNRRKNAHRKPVVSVHKQPQATEKVLDKIREIRRRSGSSQSGFDAIGEIVVNARNDFTPFVIDASWSVDFPYEDMIDRLSHEYAASFNRV